MGPSLCPQSQALSTDEDLGGGREAPHLEEGGGCLEAHVGHRYPLPAGEVGVARADTGEGGEGQDSRRQRWVWGVGSVHLVGVAERPASGQRVHDLEGREEVSRADGP